MSNCGLVRSFVCLFLCACVYLIGNSQFSSRSQQLIFRDNIETILTDIHRKTRDASVSVVSQLILVTDSFNGCATHFCFVILLWGSNIEHTHAHTHARTHARMHSMKQNDFVAFGISVALSPSLSLSSTMATGRNHRFICIMKI